MAHVNQTITYYMCFKLFCHLFQCLFPRDPDKRKKKEKPTATIVDCVSAVEAGIALT